MPSAAVHRPLFSLCLVNLKVRFFVVIRNNHLLIYMPNCCTGTGLVYDTVKQCRRCSMSMPFSNVSPTEALIGYQISKVLAEAAEGNEKWGSKLDKLTKSGVKRRMWIPYSKKWGSTDPLDPVALRGL